MSFDFRIRIFKINPDDVLSKPVEKQKAIKHYLKS